MTSNSLTQNEKHNNPSQILKTILDCMSQLFLDANVCGFLQICMLVVSPTLVVNWQNLLFILFH